MDSRGISLRYIDSSPAGRFLRQIHGPPPSPCPQVPDTTEPNTGLEWFEMATSTGQASSDQGVPGSPFMAASLSSPLCNFAVPSTPVQDTWKIPLSQEKELWIPAYNNTMSPLEMTLKKAAME